MTEALEYQSLHVLPDDAEASERDSDSRDETIHDADSPRGLRLLLDRLYAAAVGAVEGAADGWANPPWTRTDALEESALPLPVAVEAVMTRTVQVIGPNATLEEAARRLWDGDCGALPVVDGSQGRAVVGIITDRDVCIGAWTRGRPLHELPVQAVMTRPAVHCRPGDSITTAHQRMREARVRRLPVLDDERNLAGVVSIADLVRRALRAPHESARAEAVSVLKTLGEIGAMRRPRPAAPAT